MTEVPKHIEVMVAAIRECRRYGRSSEDCATAAHAALVEAGYVVGPVGLTSDQIKKANATAERGMIEAAEKAVTDCIKVICRSPVACNGFGYCREKNFPVTICPVCSQETSFAHDHKPDLSGLDDGPPLHNPRKKYVAPPNVSEIRKKAWATRRKKYGQFGHR